MNKSLSGNNPPELIKFFTGKEFLPGWGPLIYAKMFFLFMLSITQAIRELDLPMEVIGENKPICFCLFC